MKKYGFIALVENHLAAIFVDNKVQGNGIGKELLNLIKKQKSTIKVKVYKRI